MTVGLVGVSLAVAHRAGEGLSFFVDALLSLAPLARLPRILGSLRQPVDFHDCCSAEGKGNPVGTPGRILTDDTRFRRPVFCTLNYGGIKTWYPEVGSNH